MDHIGIDVHKNQSQICHLTQEGEMFEWRIRTDRERFAKVLGNQPRKRILIEASTESEWVARCLEELGHEVVVADPSFAPMYATRSRRIKTDRRDARALAEACRVGAFRPAHRTSDQQRHVRAQLAVRDSLVRTRTRYISLIRSLLRREGVRMGGGTASRFLCHVQELTLPEQLQSEITPILEVMIHLNQQIDSANETISQIVEREERVRKLTTVPGVGPLTAACFVATLDQAERFHGAHQVESYLGLVPKEKSSGEKQRRGKITKAGNTRMRWLLVEAAWSIWRIRKPEATALRTWAERIAVRRGKRVATVALARRLAGILYAMMRDGTEFKPKQLPQEKPRSSVAA